MADSTALLAHLRSLAAPAVPRQADSRPVEAWLGKGLAPAQLHEVFAFEADDGPSGAGFAIACALAADAMPLLWLRTEASERQGGRLHATGLAELGLDASTLLLVLVADEAALLRAAADAARCPGLGTLLIESWGRAPGLDLTATRRLMLAAESSGVTILSLRVAAEPVPSAAATRWRVTAAPSRALEADAPGGPAFQVELLRRRGGHAGLGWCVEWNRDTRNFQDGVFGPAALSGAGLPLAPGGAAADRAPASVRRTG